MTLSEKDVSFPSFDGQAHRAIDVRATADDEVVAWLEDDFHHFGVAITHDGKHVTRVSMFAPRHPYSTCPGAAAPLRDLIGAPLVKRASDIGQWIDMRVQCTHIFDLAGLALAHAAASRTHRRYQSTVDDREVVEVHSSGRRILGPGWAVLRQDEVEVLRWALDGHEITGPGIWAGQSLKQGFRAKTETLALEPAEHAMVLRRAIMVAGGRSADRDAVLLPRENAKPAVCHTYQPSQRPHAAWLANSVRDWSGFEDKLLKNIDESQ